MELVYNVCELAKRWLLQVSVMLCAAQTLSGAVYGLGFEERWGVSGRKVRINQLLRRWGCLGPFLPFSLSIPLGVLRSFLILCFSFQRRRHDDGGPLLQVLASGGLSSYDGLCTVHPRRGLAVQVSMRLLPAPQLSVMFLLYVLFRHL